MPPLPFCPGGLAARPKLKPGLTPGRCCPCSKPRASPLPPRGQHRVPVSCSREGAGCFKTRENKQRSFLSPTSPLSQHAVVEGEADDCFLVAAVFPLDLSCLHAPKSGQVIRGGCNRRKKKEEILCCPSNVVFFFFFIRRKVVLLLHSTVLSAVDDRQGSCAERDTRGILVLVGIFSSSQRSYRANYTGFEWTSCCTYCRQHC